TVKEHQIAIEMLVGAVDAENRALLYRIGGIERDRTDLRLAAHRDVGLIVLAPADIADEARIDEDDPRPPQRDAVRPLPVSDLQPVELDIPWVRHGGERLHPVARQGVVIIVDQRQRALAFGKEGEAPRL